MSSRIRIHLSEQMTARLAAAARSQRSTRSAVIEDALDRLLGSDEDAGDATSMAFRLDAMSRQLDHLDRDLRIVNETVALHTRFHLTVTPIVPTAAQLGACALGAGRFEEFAAQVGRRVHRGTSLMQETMDRLGTERRVAPEGGFREGAPQTDSSAHEPDLRVLAAVENVSEHAAVVREDGSRSNFRKQGANPPG